MEYGLIGARLGHSFSPEIHKKIADYPYELCELTPDGVAQLMRGRSFRAINVTIPYKETVIPMLDEISPEARRIGAVNTVVNRGGRLYGYNTDYSGAAALIRHAGVTPGGKKVLLLGTGGTSKTLHAVLSDMGASEIVTVSRTAGEGRVTYAEALARHTDAGVIVNTTPVGMFPHGDECPIDIGAFPALCGVIDVIYNPLTTRLVAAARARGIPAECGLYMLAAQAVYASALFRDIAADGGIIDRVYREVLAEKRNIVLIGMPSCGKSSVGKRTAGLLGKKFIDTDALVEETAGRSIPKIFASEGEAAFRALERSAVAAAAAESGAVIATGGGAVLDPVNVAALGQNGITVFLDRPLSMLAGTADRPLARDAAALARRFEERYPIYTAVADITVPGAGSVDEVAAAVAEKTGEYRL